MSVKGRPQPEAVKAKIAKSINAKKDEVIKKSTAARNEKVAKSKNTLKNLTRNTPPEDLERDGRGGRYSRLRPEMITQAEKLCMLGATDSEIASFFDVTHGTIVHWKLHCPDFAAALRTGKSLADERVERSLFARAVGFEHPAVKVFFNHKTGEVVEHPYTEKYAPDTEACKFWLRNRRPDLWKERFETAPTDPVEAAEMAQAAVAKAMATTIKEATGLSPDAKVRAG